MLRVMCLFIALAASGLAVADVAAVYDFESRSEEQRYQNLISELRCPKCQNQNIADSNSPISKDMRTAVYQMMLEGSSNDEIVESLVGRFGEFVKYKPDLDSRTFCSGPHLRLRFWAAFLWSAALLYAPAGPA